MFADAEASGSGKRRIDRGAAESILETARTSGLVARPFRDEPRQAIEGICFCCDDCCWYFRRPEERCDKGALIERTRMEGCTHCGLCVAPCHFHARSMGAGALVVERALCYGCGLCVVACPEGCVEMVQRGA